MAARKKPVQPTTAGPEVIVPVDTPKAAGKCNIVTSRIDINGVPHHRRCDEVLQEGNYGSLKGKPACPTHEWRNFGGTPRQKTQSEKAFEQLVVNPTISGTHSKPIIDAIVGRELIPPRDSSYVEPRPSSELAETGLGGTIKNPVPAAVQAHNEEVAAPTHSVDYIGSTGGGKGVPGPNPGRINSQTSTLADYKHWAATNGHHVHFADESCSAVDPVTGRNACDMLRPATSYGLYRDRRHPFVKKLLGVGAEYPMLDEPRNLVIHTDHRTPEQRDFNHPSYIDPIHSSERIQLLSTSTIPWFAQTGSMSSGTRSVGSGLSDAMTRTDQPPRQLRANARGAKGARALPDTPTIYIPPVTDGESTGFVPGKNAMVHPGLLMRQAHNMGSHVGAPQMHCPTCVEDSHKEDHGMGHHALDPEQGCPLC